MHLFHMDSAIPCFCPLRRCMFMYLFVWFVHSGDPRQQSRHGPSETNHGQRPEAYHWHGNRSEPPFHLALPVCIFIAVIKILAFYQRGIVLIFLMMTALLCAIVLLCLSLFLCGWRRVLLLGPHGRDGSVVSAKIIAIFGIGEGPTPNRIYFFVACRRLEPERRLVMLSK